MIAGPVFVGAVHVTVNPVAVTLEIVGADGADGGSFTSVTVTVIACTAVSVRGLVPLVAVTSTR